MNEKIKPPTYFWVAAVLLLLWNGMGVAAYLSDVMMASDNYAAVEDDAMRAMYLARPAWATAAFAVAVFAGILGCAALLLRKALATWLFVLSLLGVIVQDSWAFTSGGATQLGPQAYIFPVIILALLLFSIWLSRKATNQGWST